MKKVCGCCYVHKSNVEELLLMFDGLRNFIPNIEEIERVSSIYNVKTEIVKYDKKQNKVSFIESPDWNESNEPIVGDSFCIDLNTMNVKFKKGRSKNPQIYHSKELFVSSDYKGFDIERAKKRTKEWNSIANLDKKRIGNKDFWLNVLKENRMEE